MVAKRRTRSTKTVKSVKAKSLTSKQAKGVKGGFGASNPAGTLIRPQMGVTDGTSNTVKT